MSNLDTSDPIQVAAKPATVQLSAGIRQVAMSAAVILGAFGASGLAAKANIVVSVAPEIATVLVVVGPVVWGAVFGLGQMVTRARAKEAAAMAAQLPDRVATLK